MTAASIVAVAAVLALGGGGSELSVRGHDALYDSHFGTYAVRLGSQAPPRLELVGARQTSLSGDGRWIAYDVPNQGAGVFVSAVFFHRRGAPVNGSRDARFSPRGFDPYEVWAPDWSPRTSEVAAFARRPGGPVGVAPELIVARPDGSHVRVLARRLPASADGLRWSPDGARLAWLVHDRTHVCVQSVPSRGGHVRSDGCALGAPAGLAFSGPKTAVLGTESRAGSALWTVPLAGSGAPLPVAAGYAWPAAGASGPPPSGLPPARAPSAPRYTTVSAQPHPPRAPLRGHPAIGAGGQWYGVTLSGYEDGRWPAYTRRRMALDLAAFHRRGVNLIRFTFDWQYLQHRIGGPFARRYLAGLDFMVRRSAALGMALILDMHDYFKFGSHGEPSCPPSRCQDIGTPAVPVSTFADVWARIARRYKRFHNVQWSLNTEPFDVPGPQLAAAYQAAIYALRRVTHSGSVIVDAGSWASVEDWPDQSRQLLGLRDPANKLLYDEHVYFDNDAGGLYKRPYSFYARTWAGLGPRHGRIHAAPLRQMQPFLAWLARHHKRALIGEIGVAANDKRNGTLNPHAAWIGVLSRAYAYLASQRKLVAGVVYWAGGVWECRPNDNELPASDGSSGGVCRHYHGTYPQLTVVGRYRWPGLVGQ